MNITSEDLKSLQKFASNFDEYHDVANKVFSISNGRDYMSRDDFEQLRIKEKSLRRNLNEDFGGLERVIYNLLGGKPLLAVQGRQWDVFAEAFSANFNIVKGESLNYAEDALSKAVGTAKKMAKEPVKDKVKLSTNVWFSEDLIKKISDPKIKALCLELNSVSLENPNATALLMRTILLLVLQSKIGKTAKDDLRDVLNQAISQDVYGDTHIKRILTNFSTIPKTMLDASHHSKWVIIKKDDLGIWLPGLVNIVEATFK